MELIKFNHTTKEKRLQLVREIFNEVLNGRVNPLELHVGLKSAEEVIKQLTGMEPYKAILLDEAQKFGKSFDYQTAKIDIREVGVKYDYLGCGNSKLAVLYDQQKKIEAEINAIETYHKGLPAAGVQVLNLETGEVETHYPPSKSSTTSVAVTLK